MVIWIQLINDGKILKYIVNSIAIVVLIVLAAAIFANAMTKEPARDEQMYCTAGVLMSQGKMIYRDFSYVAQMPYHPLIYSVLFKLSGTTHYLLAGRLTSVFCDIMVMVCIFGIYLRVLGKNIAGVLIGLASVVIYVFNPITDYSNGYAWNNDVVLLCVMLSFWLFVSAGSDRAIKSRWIFLIAVLLTLATFMRITTAIVQLAFFTAILYQPFGSGKEKLKVVGTFLFGTFVASIWPVYIILCAPKAFFLNAIRIQMLNSEWLHKIGMVHDKSVLIRQSLTTCGYLSLIITALILLVLTWLNRKRIQLKFPSHFFLAVSLIIIFFAIAIILPTTWKQHLAMPVPFIIIALAQPIAFFHKARPNKLFLTASSLVIICAAIAVISFPIVLQRIPAIFDRQNWIPIHLHKISKDIAAKAGDDCQILTLAPLWALEGGCDIYPELSAGPFVYRIGDFLTPQDRALTHTTGPDTVAELIKASPPCAVILGADMPFLEETLYQAVVTPAWKQQDYIDAGLRVYFRP